MPPYTYVPGVTPHPFSDPAGHSYGKAPVIPAPINPSRWWECKPYLYGIHLFNGPAPPPGGHGPRCGYYWEAHEVWEGLWRAAGRSGLTADFLKGLIKLAAAGVKVLQGQPRGVRSHAGRAAEAFRRTAEALGGADSAYLGLRLAELVSCTGEIVQQAEACHDETADGAQIDFHPLLRPALPNGL